MRLERGVIGTLTELKRELQKSRSDLTVCGQNRMFVNQTVYLQVNMDQFELYDEVALYFPSMWPKQPEWTWVNIHDGQRLKSGVLAELVGSTINSSEVIVIVHSTPGIAVRLPIENVENFVAKIILVHDFQVSNQLFGRVVSVSREGVATCDA